MSSKKVQGLRKVIKVRVPLTNLEVPITPEAAVLTNPMIGEHLGTGSTFLPPAAVKKRVRTCIKLNADGQQVKLCSKCLEEKLLSHFYKQGTRYSGYCKPCYNPKPTTTVDKALKYGQDENGNPIKLCKNCQTSKLITEFHASTCSYCKACATQRTKFYSSRNQWKGLTEDQRQTIHDKLRESHDAACLQCMMYGFTKKASIKLLEDISKF